MGRSWGHLLPLAGRVQVETIIYNYKTEALTFFVCFCSLFRKEREES